MPRHRTLSDGTAVTGATLVNTWLWSCFEQLDTLAAKRDISRAELVKIAVEDYLTRNAS